MCKLLITSHWRCSQGTYAGSVPSSIREDDTKTLLQDDIVTHMIVRKLITGRFDRKFDARAKRLRLCLLGLFKEGGQVWYMNPANGICEIVKIPQKAQAVLLAWVMGYRPYAGDYQGEYGMIRLAQHIQHSLNLDTVDMRRLANYADRVMSGKAFNTSVRKAPPQPLQTYHKSISKVFS